MFAMSVQGTTTHRLIGRGTSLLWLHLEGANECYNITIKYLPKSKMSNVRQSLVATVKLIYILYMSDHWLLLQTHSGAHYQLALSKRVNSKESNITADFPLELGRNFQLSNSQGSKQHSDDPKKCTILFLPDQSYMKWSCDKTSLWLGNPSRKVDSLSTCSTESPLLTPKGLFPWPGFITISLRCPCFRLHLAQLPAWYMPKHLKLSSARLLIFINLDSCNQQDHQLKVLPSHLIRSGSMLRLLHSSGLIEL